MAGYDKEFDPYELQDALNGEYAGDVPGFEGFNIDICRSMVALGDTNFSGKLGPREYRELTTELEKWKEIFLMFDTDGSGCMSNEEVGNAFSALGIELGEQTFKAVCLRYSNREGKLTFADFISCLVKLETMYETAKQKEQEQGTEGEVTFAMDEFMPLTIYT